MLIEYLSFSAQNIGPRPWICQQGSSYSKQPESFSVAPASLEAYSDVVVFYSRHPVVMHQADYVDCLLTIREFRQLGSDFGVMKRSRIPFEGHGFLGDGRGHLSDISDEGNELSPLGDYCLLLGKSICLIS